MEFCKYLVCLLRLCLKENSIMYIGNVPAIIGMH